MGQNLVYWSRLNDAEILVTMVIAVAIVVHMGWDFAPLILGFVASHIIRIAPRKIRDAFLGGHPQPPESITID